MDAADADQTDQDSRPTETPAGSAGGFGDSLDRFTGLRAGAQRVGKAAAKIGAGVGKGATKLLGTVFGPGSKIKIGIIVIDVGVYLLALVLFVIGLTTMSLGNSGSGGTTPAQSPDLTQAELQHDLKLITCLDAATPPPVEPDKKDTAADDGTRLSPECMKINREQAVKIKEKIAELRKQLTSRGKNEAARAPAGKLLDDIEAELTAIDTANGKYQPTKEHVTKLNSLVDQFVIVWSSLAFSCDNSSQVVGPQSPQNPKLFQLKAGGASPIVFYFGQTSRENTYVSKDMACYLATLTVEAKKQLGIRIEVGDASTQLGQDAWGPHSQHGGGGNADIWAEKVMIDRPEGGTYDDGAAQKLAQLILDLGGKELFITWDRYRDSAWVQRYSVNASGHSDHWHICIHNGC